MVWFELVKFGLIGLIWFGLGLDWFDLIWLGWFGLA
jgi:hypothetical protein